LTGNEVRDEISEEELEDENLDDLILDRIQD
jgi:hypothetical protein